MPGAEKDRLHRILSGAAIRHGVVVSDIHVRTAHAMVKAIIDRKPMAEVFNLDLAGQLHASRKELFEALQPEESGDARLFVLTEIKAQIEELEARLGCFEQALLQGLSAWQR